jgi:hypothetical protein
VSRNPVVLSTLLGTTTAAAINLFFYITSALSTPGIACGYGFGWFRSKPELFDVKTPLNGKHKSTAVSTRRESRRSSEQRAQTAVLRLQHRGSGKPCYPVRSRIPLIAKEIRTYSALSYDARVTRFNCRLGMPFGSTLRGTARAAIGLLFSSRRPSPFQVPPIVMESSGCEASRSYSVLSDAVSGFTTR